MSNVNGRCKLTLGGVDRGRVEDEFREAKRWPVARIEPRQKRSNDLARTADHRDIVEHCTDLQ
jgi:hypothetical protein